MWAHSARFARAGSRGDTHIAIGGGYGVRPGRLGGKRARSSRMHGAIGDGWHRRRLERGDRQRASGGGWRGERLERAGGPSGFRIEPSGRRGVGNGAWRGARDGRRIESAGGRGGKAGSWRGSPIEPGGARGASGGKPIGRMLARG